MAGEEVMWSPQQDEALVKVDRWLKSGETPVFRLFGYAGTGKTTLARHLAEGVDGDVRFAAFTGKAAQVLRESGARQAGTIHSLIYRAKEKSRSRLLKLEEAVLQASDPARLRELKELLEAERKSLSRPAFDLNSFDNDIKKARLIVIDECSMVDGKMGQDLLSFKVPVLVLGDPAQLPPVAGGGFFTENATPDVMLTEIHRQARDNPIIQLATSIREGNPLALGSWGDSRVIAPSGLRPGEAVEYDQILVGKNATRRHIINKCRAALGFDSPFPVEGEKLICLRNNHDRGLLNGSMWRGIACAPGTSEESLLLSVESLEGGEPFDTEVHAFPFLGKTVNMPYWERSEFDEFDFGHAVTVHKAQGSQWGRVLLYDEWHSADSRQRWLYTAVTRAQQSVTVVRM